MLIDGANVAISLIAVLIGVMNTMIMSVFEHHHQRTDRHSSPRHHPTATSQPVPLTR